MARWSPVPVAGGAYSDDAKPWTIQDTVNRLPVYAEREGTRSPAILRDCPGALNMGSLGNSPIRGLHDAEGLLLAVCGTTLFTIKANGEAMARGTIPGVKRCSIAHNQIASGNEVLIANGNAGYVYNTKTATLTQITDQGFPGAKVVDFVDGYMAFVEPSGRYWGHSNLADATDYNTLDRSEAESQPDRIVSLIVSHREVVLLGERTVEFFGNTGAATGTFQRKDGTEMEVGCASTFSVAKLDNAVFWLGNDGIVYRMNGYQPQRISTHAIEQAISRCNLASAYAFTFEDRGHKVYYLTFTDGHTWGYDVATGEWHRRLSEGLDFWRMSHLVRWNGRWVAGDYANGNLYQLDWSTSNEAGNELTRSRTFGVSHDNQNRIVMNAVELVYDTGAKPEPATAIPLDIQIALSGDLADGTVGDAGTYAYTATYATAPLTFSIGSGSLPPGATLGADGVVTYDYTTAGSYSWTVHLEDATARTADLDDAAVIEGFDPALTSSKYLLVDFSDATDYSAPSFDDSAWSTGLMPLGTSTVPDAATYGFPSAIATTWPLGKNAWFRASFTVTTVTDMLLEVYLDDAAEVWVNGVSVFNHTTDDGGGTTYFWQETVAAENFVEGVNKIAIKCRADIHGVNNYVCYRFTPA